MNLFLIDTDPWASAEQLLAADPVRARKQLLEACQLLANYSKMLKADGTPYGKAHPHHPITKHMRVSKPQYRLCWDVAYGLAMVLPKHACSKSLLNSCIDRSSVDWTQTGMVVCRAGLPQLMVQTRQEYVDIIRAYCRDVKGMPL